MQSECDIGRLLTYDGPSLQQQQPIADGFVLLGYRNTDQNERNISILLSAQGIPFRIERPKPGWKGRNIRLEVTLPRARRDQALALLSAGVRAGKIEEIEGFRDLLSRG